VGTSTGTGPVLAVRRSSSTLGPVFVRHPSPRRIAPARSPSKARVWRGRTVGARAGWKVGRRFRRRDSAMHIHCSTRQCFHPHPFSSCLTSSLGDEPEYKVPGVCARWPSERSGPCQAFRPMDRSGAARPCRRSRCAVSSLADTSGPSTACAAFPAGKPATSSTPESHIAPAPDLVGRITAPRRTVGDRAGLGSTTTAADAAAAAHRRSAAHLSTFRPPARVDRGRPFPTTPSGLGTVSTPVACPLQSPLCSPTFLQPPGGNCGHRGGPDPGRYSCVGTGNPTAGTAAGAWLVSSVQMEAGQSPSPASG